MFTGVLYVFELITKRLPAAFLLCLFLAPVSAATASPALDDTFLDAREAARLGDRTRLARLAPALETHELAAYVEYWRLSALLAERKENIDGAALRPFLMRHEGDWLAEKLRSDWLRQLGKAQRWQEFDVEYPRLLQPEQELACHALSSRRLRGDAGVAEAALPLWLSLLEPPDGCYPVLEALIVDKRVLADDVWARIRRQFEANKMAAARYSMNYLPPSQTPDARLIDNVIERPLPWLVKLPGGTLSRMQRELAALAVQRIARNDTQQAAEQLARLESRLQAGERGWAWSQIAWRAAQKHQPEALEWFARAGEAPLSDEAAQWKVRAALRVQAWAQVRDTIERMSPALAAQPDWIYWLGRAYRAGGRLEEATALFARIAGQPHFYGNLASDELDRPIVPPPRTASPTRDELAQAEDHPGLRRALALFRLGLRFEGTREWNWALRGMGDRQLLAASALAQRAGVYDRAIAAADRTREEHDYTLRYLAPFGDEVRPAARSQSLDDAWVYGLIRQESRFITDARSSAGAGGLMQLMPATARWVARKIGLQDFRSGQVNDPQTNILLGTSYMRLVLESLDNHPVLASAAYNAGPGRARNWRADRPLEGAIYAETIPFSETRDYVKKVMSNSVYYAALFDGRPQSLKPRLGMIPARTGGEGKIRDLP